MFELVNWLEDHALPCPFKAITGCDCPFCGFQRSIFACFRGHLVESALIHPAGIPVLMLTAFALFRFALRKPLSLPQLNAFLILLLGLSMVSYVVKWLTIGCCG